MAIHNYVSLFGVVRTAPQIKTGMYGRTAMVAVTVVRGDRKEDTIRYILCCLLSAQLENLYNLRAVSISWSL